VKSYIDDRRWQRKLVHEFTEIESGRINKRPEIQKALAMSKARKARLVIAKLDRLARNVLFIAQLMETKVDFYACDLPEASPLHIHIMAAMAEHEAKMISTRIREALARSKKKLGWGPLPERQEDGRKDERALEPGQRGSARPSRAAEERERAQRSLGHHRQGAAPRWADFCRDRRGAEEAWSRCPARRSVAPEDGGSHSRRILA
jgi:DNA invertase Pin-like site-specific DNA recombinase